MGELVNERQCGMANDDGVGIHLFDGLAANPVEHLVRAGAAIGRGDPDGFLAQVRRGGA